MIIDDVNTKRETVALESLPTYVRGYDHDGLRSGAFITRSEVLRQRKQLTARTLTDRERQPAPFAVGTVVRYMGPTLHASGIAPMRRDALVHAQEYTVVRIDSGRRGDLTQAEAAMIDADDIEVDDGHHDPKMWWDDEHRVPLLSVTIDDSCALKGTRGRYITAANAHLWVPVT